MNTDTDTDQENAPLLSESQREEYETFTNGNSSLKMKRPFRTSESEENPFEDDCWTEHEKSKPLSTEHSPGPKIGLASLVFLVFFVVSGGPIGTEESISSVGPVYGLLGIFVFPWIYSVPLALVSAELCTAFPQDGGYTIWVKEAFGFTLAFQEGYWSWISGVMDNAMYPVLITELLVGNENKTSYWYLPICLTLGISILNYFGLRILGRTLCILCGVVIFPYIILVSLGIFQIVFPSLATHNDLSFDPGDGKLTGNLKASIVSQLQKLNDSQAGGGAADIKPPWERDWLLLLNILFWNYSGWDSVSTFAGEVSNPSFTFPLGLGLGVLLVTLSYVLPLLVALLLLPTLHQSHTGSVIDSDYLMEIPDWHIWKEGSFLDIGMWIGGPLLHLLLEISGISSAVAMYSTELFVDSYLLLGMSEQKLLPKIFQRRTNKLGIQSPYVAISVNVLIMVVIIQFLDFEQLLHVNNCLSALSILLELVAAVYLRIKQPNLNRPYKVPVSTFGFVMLLACPFILLFVLIITGFVLSPPPARMTTVVLFVLGFLSQRIFSHYTVDK